MKCSQLNKDYLCTSRNNKTKTTDLPEFVNEVSIKTWATEGITIPDNYEGVGCLALETFVRSFVRLVVPLTDDVIVFFGTASCTKTCSATHSYTRNMGQS